MEETKQNNKQTTQTLNLWTFLQTIFRLYHSDCYCLVKLSDEQGQLRLQLLGTASQLSNMDFTGTGGLTLDKNRNYFG